MNKEKAEFEIVKCCVDHPQIRDVARDGGQSLMGWLQDTVDNIAEGIPPEEVDGRFVSRGLQDAVNSGLVGEVEVDWDVVAQAIANADYDPSGFRTDWDVVAQNALDSARSETPRL